MTHSNMRYSKHFHLWRNGSGVSSNFDSAVEEYAHTSTVDGYGKYFAIYTQNKLLLVQAW